MNFDELYAHCMSKKGAEETFPFDESTLVFKVAGKMFALTGLNSEDLKINLKCDPERAIQLREQYSDIAPGFHMSKKHWNTVNCEGELEHALILELIDHSYSLVVKGLPQKLRNQLNAL